MNYSREVLKDEQPDNLIPQHLAQRIIKYVKRVLPEYYTNNKVKNVLNSSFTFRGADHPFKPNSMYNKIRKSDYPMPETWINEYLPKNVKIIHQEFRNVFKMYPSVNNFFILDPPYLMTSKEYYENEKYFNIKDSVDIVYFTINHKCILFESDKSGIQFLYDFIKRLKKVELKYSVVPLNNKLNEVIILCNF